MKSFPMTLDGWNRAATAVVAAGPVAVQLDTRELLIIRRAWKPLRIARSEISGAEVGALKDFAWLRLAGVGGFFGAYGLFWRPGVGLSRLYATRKGPAVKVSRSGG